MGIKKALSTSLDAVAPVIEDRTILIIDVPIEETVYTYAALFVNKRWYLTGSANLLGKEYQGTVDLLIAIGRFPGAKIALVTETEVVR